MSYRIGDPAKYEGHIFSPDDVSPVETSEEVFTLAYERERPTDEFLERTGLKRQITPDEVRQVKDVAIEGIRDPDKEWAGFNLHDIPQIIRRAIDEVNKEIGPDSKKDEITEEIKRARSERYVPRCIEKLIGVVGERVSANMRLSRTVTVAVSNAYVEIDDVGEVQKTHLKVELENIGDSEIQDVYEKFGTTQKDFILIQTLLSDMAIDTHWRERILVQQGVGANGLSSRLGKLKEYCQDLIDFYSDFENERKKYLERHNGGASVPIIATEYIALKHSEKPLDKIEKATVETVLNEVYDMIGRPQKPAQEEEDGPKVVLPELITAIYDDNREKTHRLLLSGYFENTIPDAYIESVEDPDKIGAVIEVKAWDARTIKSWISLLKAAEDEQHNSVEESQTKYERSGLQVKILTRNERGDIESFKPTGPNIRGIKTFANLYNHTNGIDIPVILRFTDEITNDETAYLQSLLTPEDGIVIFQRLPTSARGPKSLSSLATEFVQDYVGPQKDAVVNQIAAELKKTESWELKSQ